MTIQKAFKMPTKLKITSRTSSITNAFVNAIIPVIQPTEDQTKKALEILNISADEVQCAYCGTSSTEWDHLRPLVENKKPTGYISEIQNLVPACGKCNQSKGNKYWKDWMLSDAALSPKSKGVPDLQARIKRLEEYEKSWNPTKINFSELVGKEMMDIHQKNLDEIYEKMQSAQSHANSIAQTISNHLEGKS